MEFDPYRDPRTDELLIEALRQGERGAFELIYARYGRRLYAYVRRMVDHESSADDLFQDILFGVLKDRSFDPRRGAFAPWLFRVARNRCLMARRSDARRKAAMERARAQPLPQGPRLDRDARVRAAMRQLPEGQQQLLILKQVGELTYREMAEALDIAEGTVKSRLHQAMKDFRHQLVLQGEA